MPVLWSVDKSTVWLWILFWSALKLSQPPGPSVAAQVLACAPSLRKREGSRGMNQETRMTQPRTCQDMQGAQHR